MNRIGRERGWPPMTRDQFEASRDAPRRELRRRHAGGRREDPLPARDLRRTTASCSSSTVGSVDHARTMRAIELYGTEVAPAVRAELARQRSPVASPSLARGVGRSRA